jgi:hypothetical protein
MQGSSQFSDSPDAKTSIPSPPRRTPHFLALSAILIFMAALPLLAAQVRIPDGTLVPLSLHYDLTTENVVKGDRVDFDVTDDVAVDGHVVIPKGAVAWATVVKVKGAGKKNAKDASVTFRLIGVHTVDNQSLGLRLLPYRSKRLDPSENDIVESSPIPGLRERMIGAPKGKQYAAYTDSDILVNAPESAPAAAAKPAAAAPAQAPAALTNGVAAPAAAAPAIAPSALFAPEPAAVDFRSKPSGADILIDSNFVGNTPSTLTVKPGIHEIEIRIQGYSSWDRKMKVAPGSHPSVLANLVKK